MKNKPQWLIDAENEINNFEQTKFGKMTDKEFRLSERQSNAGKSGGSKLISLGKNNATVEGRLKGLEIGRSKGASSKGGKKNVESGHLAKVRNPSKAGSAASKSENSVNKQKFQCPPTSEHPEGRVISRNWLKWYCDKHNLNIEDCIRVN